MRTVEETRTRRLQLLEGVLTLPLMYAPAGYGIEACILDALMELAFIDDKVGQLDSELARLRASRLAYPDNHAYGVTSAFRTALPDFATPNREG